MKSLFLTLTITTFCIINTFAQNNTEASLFLRSDSLYTNEVKSETGDMYKKVGHHGPAVENEWLALRIYFNNKATSIDVYNKQQKGLELKTKKWYPSVEEQKEGFGADYYKVGPTVGLGGVRLWDGEKEVMLAPISMRTAKVKKAGNFSQAEMLSEGVPYKGKNIDILVRVTAYSGLREMRVEAFALTDDSVQFATGINYWEGEKVTTTDNYVITWGYHPEDVAAEKMKVGAAIIINPDDFADKVDDGNQQLFISKPCKYLDTWVTSTIEKDKSMGTLKEFEKYVSTIQTCEKF